MKLTPKQKRFCEEYLVDLNATQAAIRAGYSKRTANRIGAENLTKLVIKQYIEKRLAEKESELIATQDEVLRYFTSVMRGEHMSSEVVVEGYGEARVLERPPTEKESLKAADLLCKYWGARDKAKIDIRRLEMDEERLAMEKTKAEISSPDNEIKVVIAGYEDGWCD